MGSVNKYVKVVMSSSSVKAELQNIKSTLLQLSQIKAKLTELKYKCVLGEGEDDEQKVKSI